MTATPTSNTAPRRAPHRRNHCAWMVRICFLAMSLLVPLAHAALYEFVGGAIAINDLAAATPSPSAVTVSGVTGTVTSVRVKINGITHTYASDIDVFLVAPSGQVSVVFSDAGNNFPVNANLVFDDGAPIDIPVATAIVSGTYRPANYDPVESLPPGATGTIGTNLTALAGGGVNGAWKLFVSDDTAGDSGSIASWSLVIQTSIPSSTVAPLAIARGNHTTNLLNNRKLLVAGGAGLASAALYDPANGTWTGTGSMSAQRQLHSSTVLPNGKVLVAGGLTGASLVVATAELYDPATGT